MRQSIIKDGKKFCPKCQTFRLLADFGVRPNGKIRSWCKPCGVSDVATWRSGNGRWVDPLVGRIQSILAHVCRRKGDVRSEFFHDQYKKQNGKCYYTGVEMILMSKIKQDPLLMSVDRVDSSKPYTKENVVLCCLGINQLKGSHSVDRLYQSLKLLSEGAKTLGKI